MKSSTERGSKARGAWVVGGLVALAAASAWAYVKIGRGPSLANVPALGATTVTIVPGVHMLGGLGPSAAYAVKTSEGVVMIDAGLSENAGALTEELAKVGLRWNDIVAFLLTHAHGDHVGAARNLAKVTGAKIHAGKGDADVIRAGGPREAFFSTFAMPDHVPHATPVDVELVGDETLTFGDTTFRTLALPGHTPGSIGYLMERDGLRVLFAGDVITMLAGEPDPHPMGLRPLGTYSAYLSPRYRGDVRASIESLDKLRAMPVPDLILPGHPSSDPVPQSPRLSQARWEEMIDRGLAEMKTLEARYKADGTDFLDDHPKALLPGLDYLGNYRGAAVYLLTEGDRSDLIDAPGDAGLAAFVEDRRAKLSPVPPSPTGVVLTSCGPEATAGLRELAARVPLRIVASRRGFDTLKPLCPPNTEFVAAEDLPGPLGLPLKAIPLAGRGVAPAAYTLDRGGKTALLSGRIPILFDQASTAGLAADLSGSREDAIEYIGSINALEGIEPDLWLPAIPSDEQNANLYDGDWHRIITNNYRLGRSLLDRPR